MNDSESIHFRNAVYSTFTAHNVSFSGSIDKNNLSATFQVLFPYDQYSPKFHADLREIGNKSKNLDELAGVCWRAKSLIQNSYDFLKSSQNYRQFDEEKQIILRIMSEANIEDRKDWHLFTEEVLKTIENILENEGETQEIRKKLNEFAKKWNTNNGNGNYSTISVKIFEKLLKDLEIDNSNILLVPDIQFLIYQKVNPLRFEYSTIFTKSPQHQQCYHQFQAQFLIFQFGAFDIFWNSTNEQKKKEWKKKIIEEMKNIKKGYTLAEIVEKSVENVKYSELAQKTPLSHFHSKAFDAKLTKDEFLKYIQYGKARKNIGRYLKNGEEMEVWKARMFIILDWIETFFEDQNEQELKSNILKGCTFELPTNELKTMEDFENWRKSDDLVFNKYVNFSKMQIFIENVANEIKGLNETLEAHYLFDNDDKIGISKKNDRKEKTIRKMADLIPEVLAGFPDGEFIEIEKFRELLRDEIVQLSEMKNDANVNEIVTGMNCYNVFSKILYEYCDIANVEDQGYFRKKKRNIIENNGKQDEEQVKVIKKIVNEIRNVESCVKCGETCEEKCGILKKIEEFEMENINRTKILEENEGKIVKLKNENIQNKMKYREEIQKYKENLEKNEGKIENIQEEMKKYREDLKNERDSLYLDLEQKTKIADENVKKIEIELEKENEELEFELENASKKFAEIRQNVGENRKFQEEKEELFIDSEFQEDFGILEILKLTDFLDKICETCVEKSEFISFRRKFNIYLRILEDFDGNFDRIPDFPACFSGEFMQKYEEFLKKNIENEELFYEDFEFENEKEEGNDYTCLICSDLLIEEIEKCTKCKKCERKYHSECASKWLCLNSVCPNCRNFLPDPCQYPLLNC
ncbi:unnamed protein product [Caenorhabditis angaria]|uniref:RING-type domain-containing protein n=1 Tax=Caenorhabditis angaria TaxID=860376 RepID=A0A9P1I7D8_9PELO|nr:unnamed protein product [Caenorhabditis angaria]